MSDKNDQNCTVGQLRDAILEFAVRRDWLQFHTPKNLAMAIGTEAGELMEHFRWLDDNGAEAIVKDPDRQHIIGEELADVMMFCLELANVMKLDVTDAIHAKLAKNELRYPVEQSKGSARKYTEL